MSNSLMYLRQEIARLTDENQDLQTEVNSLRHYVSAVEELMDKVKSWTPDTEIMPLLDNILFTSLSVLDAKDGSLLVLDEDTKELVFVLAQGDVDDSQILGYRLPPGEGVAGWVAKYNKPTIVNLPAQDKRFLSSVDRAFNFTTNSLLAAPIVAQGQVLGVIEVLNKHSGEKFNDSDMTLITLLCRFAGEVLNRMVQEDKARKTPEKPSPA